MNPALAAFIIIVYFLVLIGIGWLTSRKGDNKEFFTGNRNSPWYLVAFGMIGASLSGVTFISIPGYVGNAGWSYMQVVLGYLIGYFIIATVLLPLYYRLNLVSIYTYLESRFGRASYKTGASFFLLSRTIGSAFRLYLVALVLQLAIFDSLGFPFALSVFITILLIWVYTFRGGIKTIVWTDTLQTFFLITAVICSVYLITDDLNLGITGTLTAIRDSEYSQIFFWDVNSPHNFYKQFLSGAFIAIVMTGLDQDMMQKNLTCRNIGDAQKNMFWFSFTLPFVNLLFLGLGALLYIYSNSKGIPIPERTDDLYPMLALNEFTPFAAIVFLLGITAAAYSSADSALTALTTSFCVDILGIEKREIKGQKKTRMQVHIGFAFLLFLVIIIFEAMNDKSAINAIFTAAGYTYGPLLGLYSFGLFTKLSVRDKLVPVVCILSPLISYFIASNSEMWWDGYKFGFEILIVNGLLTFLGLLLIMRPSVEEERVKSNV